MPDDKVLYRARLLKGSALVPEMRQLLLQWQAAPDSAARAVRENVLSSPTRRRANDVVTRVFVPRFVRSTPPDLWRPVSVLERAGWPLASLLPIHYYAAASAEPLLNDFVVQVLAERHARGQMEVRTADVERFIDGVPVARFENGRWAPSVRRRAAQGVLSTLRDFGLLRGKVRKLLAPLYLPVESFAFISRIRREVGIQAGAALHDETWRLFFLSDTAVERFFAEAHQMRLLEYHAAGSVVRIDYPGASVEDYACELVERTHRVA